MPEDETDFSHAVFFVFLILITGTVVAGDSLDTDRKVLLNLKSFLEEKNPINRGQYSQWDQLNTNPCNWSGIICTDDGSGSRVTGINLTNNNISGDSYNNFSLLTALSHLDLSQNYIRGSIPNDLSNCQNLFISISHTICWMGSST
ncbi:hypothetical protein GH714_021485 [Hevea brasiliensis]|uniref:Leucine-rich repeat-containing N-terminal plant-type domain-containing protein n=1 Tax=Hevea brasiliensis TaxID=3981 RepID=A0A6A6MBZ8_HEVBR|nr:hypothetical protein GH714_021485 [Hevea brasiliensis]